MENLRLTKAPEFDDIVLDMADKQSVLRFELWIDFVAQYSEPFDTTQFQAGGRQDKGKRGGRRGVVPYRPRHDSTLGKRHSASNGESNLYCIILFSTWVAL